LQQRKSVQGNEAEFTVLFQLQDIKLRPSLQSRPEIIFREEEVAKDV
jgi:hypothetical protein